MDNRKFNFVTRNGFTLIEVLLSLAITLLIVFNAATILKITTSDKKLNAISSNHQLGIKQISQTLHTANYQSIGSDLTFIDEKEDTYTISLDQGRVVKTPGFDIYMHDVEELYFFEENQKIYIQIIVNEHPEIYLIGTNYYQEKVAEDEEIIKPEG